MPAHRIPTFLSVLLVLLAGGGCNKSPSGSASVPAAPPPSAFFTWCEKNNFGIDAPQSERMSAGIKNLPGAPIGDMTFSAWTKCATAAEADTYLAGVEQKLRRTAQEQGVTLDAPSAASDGKFTLRYRAPRIQGTLTGSMELRDNREGDGTVKRYFVRLNHTEMAAAP